MGYFAKSSVEAVCDGIFAIVLTLLVLEIRVPHITDSTSVWALIDALRETVPKFVAWVISFFTVTVIWVNHHRIFESIKKIDHLFFWYNANLLLWVSFYPFSTALMGDYPRNKFAVSFFGIASLMMGIAFLLLRVHMWRHPDITDGYSRDELFIGVKNVLLYGPLPYVIGASVAWVHPFLAFGLYAFVTFYFMLPNASGLRRTQN